MREPDPEFEAFVARARAGSFDKAGVLCGFVPTKDTAKAKDRAGPCPACGGTDRFSVNLPKRKFNCRGCKAKGRNALALALVGEHVSFIDACEDLTGEKRPDRMRDETAAEREARLARIAAREAEIAEQRAAQEAEAERERAEKRAQAVFLWNRAHVPEHDWRGSLVETYLRFRRIVPGNLRNLRFYPRLNFKHNEQVVWTGPGMLARIEDAEGHLIGVHRTWIDPALTNGISGGKGRPILTDVKTGAALKTKKVLGEQIGGTIRLIDGLNPRRLVAGEGIETVLAVHTALTAAASPLLGACAFWSGVNLKNLRNMPVPASVEHVILLGDGDSDPESTSRDLKAAAQALARPGRRVSEVFADAGQDFASMLEAA